MADEPTSGAASPAFRCPWCSAALPSVDLETCPSCKATLTSTAEASLPGVTAIDHEAILRATREPVRQQRSRLLSWLSGEYEVQEGAEPVDANAIAPPDPVVRREILRLQIEAEIADRQAEADSIMADAAVEGRPIPGLEPEAEDELINGAEPGVVTETAAPDGAAEPSETETAAAAAAAAAPAAEPEPPAEAEPKS